MTQQESSKVARSVTLKRILIVALVAPAVFIAAFWATRTPERPRFDENAWRDATAVLQQQVGKAAVEHGVFAIPKAEILVPERSFACVPSSYTWPLSTEQVLRGSTVVVLDGPRSFLVSKSPVCPVADPVAKLDEQLARHIFGVLCYLELVEANGVTGFVDSRYSDWTFHLNDANFDNPNSPLTSDGKPINTRLVTPQQKGRLATLYFDSLVEGGAVHFLEKPDDISALGKELIERGLPVRNICDAIRVNYGLGFLTSHPDQAALPLLKRVDRITQKSQQHSKWMRLPLIRRFFMDERFVSYLAMVSDTLWAAETLAGRSEAERIQLAFDARVAGGRQSFAAAFYLAPAHPFEYARLLAEHYPTCDAKSRAESIRNYYRSWGSDVQVAQAGADDADPVARFAANWQLFSTTKDPKYLLECVGCIKSLNSDPAVNAHQLRIFYGRLAQAFFDDPTLVQVPEAFLGLLRAFPDNKSLNGFVLSKPAAAERISAVLLLAGGSENANAAMKIAGTFETLAAASPNDDYFHGTADSSIGLATLCAIANAKDPLVADTVLEFLDARKPGLDSSVCEPLIAGLAARGDSRLVGILEAALDAERRFPSTRPCRDPNVDYENITFRQFLSRALVTVEMRNAPDPIAYLGDSTGIDLGLMTQPVARFFADRYTTSELQAFLADDRCARIRTPLYLALCIQHDKIAATGAPERGQK